MKKISLSFAVCCFIVSLFHISVSAEPFRLSQDVIPLEQSIHLHLNPDDADYSGPDCLGTPDANISTAKLIIVTITTPTGFSMSFSTYRANF